MCIRDRQGPDPVLFHGERLLAALQIAVLEGHIRCGFIAVGNVAVLLHGSDKGIQLLLGNPRGDGRVPAARLIVVSHAGAGDTGILGIAAQNRDCLLYTSRCV